MVTVIAVMLAVAAVLPWIIDEGPRWYYHIDFDVYRKGGEAFLAGDNLYTRDYEMLGINLPFTYPPLAAILFAPLAWIPFSIGALAMTLVTVAALWWCIVIVARHALPGRTLTDHRVLATWILPVALVIEPVRETLSFGQVNVLLMTMVLVDTLTRRPWLPRGVFIGLAAAIKLTPAVFVLVFVVRRQWRRRRRRWPRGRFHAPGRGDQPGQLADLLVGHPVGSLPDRRTVLRLESVGPGRAHPLRRAERGVLEPAVAAARRGVLGGDHHRPGAHRPCRYPYRRLPHRGHCPGHLAGRPAVFAGLLVAPLDVAGAVCGVLRRPRLAGGTGCLSTHRGCPRRGHLLHRPDRAALAAAEPGEPGA
ncbi:glycosyltransferase 87 family protein [Corynebacterium suedekumii]|nr:glycosyltransferase 87 family protein [Corynebacterium suedekumii]